MFEKFDKLEINIIQALAITGIVVSIVAQIGLFLMAKHVDNLWCVYVFWAFVLVLSTVFKGSGDAHDHHHHHPHHHDH